MFNFCEENGCHILKSSYITKANAFFTTRDFDIEKYLKQKEELGISVKRPKQTHSDIIESVDFRSEYPNCDGLILNRLNTLVCLKFADCTPLIFFDDKTGVGAVIHAGWRGTAAKIGVKTVEKLRRNYGVYPADLSVLIGPAIGLCCYEVSEDVKNKCLDTVKNKQDLCRNNNIDLKKINARQLEEIGVKKIDICSYCTSCDNNLFYSYRKENGTDKRHFAILEM